jgi:DNA-binding NtrC family response regulator
MDIGILFVEDDEHLRAVLVEAATLEGYKAVGVESGEAAIARLSSECFDILVTDVTMPGMSGLELLPHLPRLCPDIIPIVITAYGTIDTAVEAMKRGATDFLTKPFEYATLSGALRVAAERVRHRRRAPAPAAETTIAAAAPTMLKLLEQVRAIAPFQTTVLITGETGTGKELIARELHRQSQRAARAFVAMNCAAVPEQLLEDELFGHVKGAFTGAQVAREGRFERADGGTLFLDEIGDMSLLLQAKLLRVLQEREFEKLGSSRPVKVDVRVVAATSADLQRRIDEGSFRPDLYYRLNVVHLRLPPLRERREDIRPLAEVLLARFCRSAGLPPKTIDAQALLVIESYAWPGNVRQLQNVLERAAALSGVTATIGVGDLPDEMRADASANAAASPAAADATALPDEGVNFDAVVTKVERDLLLQALAKAGGKKLRAAKLLGMKRTTFVEKLKRLQIDAAEDDEEQRKQG